MKVNDGLWPAFLNESTSGPNSIHLSLSMMRQESSFVSICRLELLNITLCQTVVMKESESNTLKGFAVPY